MLACSGKWSLLFGWALSVATLVAGPAAAQAPKAAGAKQGASGRFRALAPGVEVTIPAEKDVAAESSRHDIVEILASDPEFGARPKANRKSPAENKRFTHDIWALEFTFKPMRMIDVDIPTDEGRFVRKRIWYLIYRIKNPGEQPVRFVPEFRLESWDTGKVYPDRFIPVAIPEIERREDASRRLLNAAAVLPEAPARLFNTIEMEREIPPSPEGQDLGIWGVATWEDIDPATDHFSIYIKGLTNAYRWEDAKSGEPAQYVFKKGDKVGTGRTLLQKTLRLNFWRPSDKYYEHEDEIRYGYYDDSGEKRFNLKPEEKVDYLWVYR
jgi:hypothetical protein